MLTIQPHIISFNLQARLRFHCLKQKVIIAVGTVLVTLLELLHVFSKAFLALLAGEGHFESLFERVRLAFGMALRAVEPLPAAWGADGDLGGSAISIRTAGSRESRMYLSVQDVLAGSRTVRLMD